MDSDTNKKCILYLEPGDRRAGICSYAMQVMAMAKVCKSNNIPMYIDFSKDMIYYKVNSTNDNVWEYYFEQPSPGINLDEYEKIRAVWYQDNRAHHPPHRYESDSEFLKQARGYCKEFIKIRPDLTAVGDNFLAQHTNGKFLAVHKRGCDHTNASDFRQEHYLLETDKYIDGYEQLLVCSDEEYAIDAFKQRYGSKVFSYNSARALTSHEGKVGVHYLPNTDNFVYRNGRDCIIESYLMSRSAFLLRTVSNVTGLSVMYNENLNFAWIDRDYRLIY